MRQFLSAAFVAIHPFKKEMEKGADYSRFSKVAPLRQHCYTAPNPSFEEMNLPHNFIKVWAQDYPKIRLFVCNSNLNIYLEHRIAKLEAIATP